jgi:hypothetical protein
MTAVALLLALQAASAPQTPPLTTVLDRAGAYVAEFHRRLSSIVAEERYVQDWKTLWTGKRRGATELGHRELGSDLLLVKPAGAAAWMTFRDVFEVDGVPVRDRSERLLKLFVEPSPSTDAQIRNILAESARYNIGDIQRNVNSPVYPLLFLEKANRFRFKFKQTADRTPAASQASPDGAFRVSTEVWVIAYDEVAPGTMIRTNDRKDIFAHGRFWIEPSTGQVLMSELVVQNRILRATIDVSFQSEPLLGLLVPIEMRERYEGRRHNSLIEGRATYGRFRQFQVNTNEQFLIKK